MRDQAASLRELVQGKVEYGAQQTLPRKAERADGGSSAPAAGPEAPPPGAFRPSLCTGARVIAVTSGKGGVGKTNLTVNLALALMRLGQRVLVVDADLGMANVDVVLGTSSKHHLLHLLQPETALSDVLMHAPQGVAYISGGSAIERALEFSPQERQCLMDKLAGCESLADIVLVDTGAGLGQNVLDFVLAADEVILVTTPEPTALTDAYAVMKAYRLHAAGGSLKLVVNRAYDEREGREVFMKLRRTSEKFLSMPVQRLGSIYEDRSVMQAIRRQSPLLELYPDAAAARCIEAVAKNLLYGGRHEAALGWRGFLRRLLKFS